MFCRICVWNSRLTSFMSQTSLQPDKIFCNGSRIRPKRRRKPYSAAIVLLTCEVISVGLVRSEPDFTQAYNLFLVDLLGLPMVFRQRVRYEYPYDRLAFECFGCFRE